MSLFGSDEASITSFISRFHSRNKEETIEEAMVIEERVCTQMNCNKALQNEQLDKEYDVTFNKNETERIKKQVEPIMKNVKIEIPPKL